MSVVESAREKCKDVIHFHLLLANVRTESISQLIGIVFLLVIWIVKSLAGIQVDEQPS